MPLFGAAESLGDDVERIVPGNRSKSAAVFAADPTQRLREPIGMMRSA
jgi:hypothetical protein